MAKWIKVHVTWKREPTWVNTNHIWRIARVNIPGNHTHSHTGRAMILRSDQQDDYISVCETPEEIMELIDAATALADALKGD